MRNYPRHHKGKCQNHDFNVDLHIANFCNFSYVKRLQQMWIKVLQLDSKMILLFASTPPSISPAFCPCLCCILLFILSSTGTCSHTDDTPSSPPGAHSLEGKRHRHILWYTKFSGNRERAAPLSFLQPSFHTAARSVFSRPSSDRDLPLLKCSMNPGRCPWFQGLPFWPQARSLAWSPTTSPRFAMLLSIWSTHWPESALHFPVCVLFFILFPLSSMPFYFLIISACFNIS